MRNTDLPPDVGSKKVLFGEIIQQALKDRRISQAALADMLGVSRNTVNNWVADRYKPEHDLIVELCGILGLTLNELYGTDGTDDLSRTEKAMIGNYRLLSDTGRRAVVKIVADILDEEIAAQDEYLRESFMIIEAPKTKAAAGQGCAFTDLPSEHVFIRRNHINSKADAMIEVSGDSMLPVYEDGDFVYIRYADTAYPGQDVVCSSANGGIIKRVTSDYKLMSVNPALPFGEKGEDDNIRIVGVVLGIADPRDRPTEKELASLYELFADELRELDPGDRW